ncbi:MAG: hypothetical protein MUE54_07475 [Anaerolineae bacterium]|nr:hypothetical protein [Anaerolineae bacterium]
MMLPRMTARKTFFGFATVLLLIPSIILAQTANTCPDIVNTAILAADELCTGLGRNTICYGNFHLEATPQDGVNRWSFEQIGDVEDVNNLERLQLSPMDESTGEWGVAVMALQANLPDTLPGQNVTFILFGDVTIENVTTPEQIENNEFSPMQAFYLTTGIGEAGCAEAPESGMLVQTPRGVGEVVFNVNGVDVAIGSTVFFQADSIENLVATTVEGSAALTVDEQTYPVLAGTRFALERRDDAIMENLPEAYTEQIDRLQALPLRLLDREIEIHPPLDEDTLAELHRRIRNREPLCGGDRRFPVCENVTSRLGGVACVFPEAYPNNLVPRPLARNPICPASQFYDNSRPPDAGNRDDTRTCIQRPGPNDPPLPANETRPFCETVNPPPTEDSADDRNDDNDDDGGDDNDDDDDD